MSSKLKVYGWTAFWNDDRNRNRHKQARMIMAASSKKSIWDAMRSINRFVPRGIEGIQETGMPREVQLAMTSPGVIFARDLDAGAFDPIYQVHPPAEHKS